MIRPPMRRRPKLLILGLTSLAVAASIAACGTQRLSVPGAGPAVHNGAVLFSERCAGCHSLAYAGTHGSAANVRSREITDGPNFNVRCERPVTRVLYAIENGGFSGAIMPQNIVLGNDAKAVAQFVSTYAGRQAPKIVGQQVCQSQPIGTFPAPGATTGGSTSTSGGGGASSPNSKSQAPVSSNPGGKSGK
jgi:mono/diheme cytochrome c family protein